MIDYEDLNKGLRFRTGDAGRKYFNCQRRSIFVTVHNYEINGKNHSEYDVIFCEEKTIVALK
ncbi:hypothetical protein QR98_0011610 [Sarcoptes scabiei]|uniref:Uncharacterized protein n=1 Tax=Sarcoptes scabiei TaxID=52283 RepID=A0A131ZV92_SARSC|nr:hypothetical protein QR98_0011610 [Sarcoptes scabiei]